MADNVKPVPVVDDDSRVYWEGCKANKLLIRQCRSCQTPFFYPRAICPGCMSMDLDWIESTGQGFVYSYTIARRPAHPSFADDVPYVVALIDLKEGVRMLSGIVGCDVNEVRCGKPVRVVFEERAGFNIPLFKLREE